MFEHLINSAEQFRNSVINLNKELDEINDNMESTPVEDTEKRKELLYSLLSVKDKINNLYRINKEDLYKQ